MTPWIKRSLIGVAAAALLVVGTTLCRTGDAVVATATAAPATDRADSGDSPHSATRLDLLRLRS